jgi:hypothetical protein
MKPLTPVPLLALAALLAGCSSSSDEPSANPSVTPSIAEPRATPSSDGTNVEAFCSLVAEGRDAETDAGLLPLTEEMWNTYNQATTDDDPAAIAAIRAWGDAELESGEVTIPIYEDLLTLTDDPVLERALEIMIEANGDSLMPIATAFSEIDTLTKFSELMTDFTTDMYIMLADPANREAFLYLDDYSIENCGFPFSTSQGSADPSPIP